MKAKAIEVGKEYAVASPNRSSYSTPHAGRVTVVAVGVYGKTGDWRGRTEHENYVLVKDWSNMERSEAEHGVSYTMGIREHADEKSKGYYREKLGLGPAETFPERLFAVPCGWVLKPWERFEAEAEEILEGRKAAAVRSSEARETMERVASRLKELGMESAYNGRGRIELSTKDAEALATLLEGAGLMVEAES